MSMFNYGVHVGYIQCPSILPISICILTTVSRVLRLDIMQIAKNIQRIREAHFAVPELPGIALFCSVNDQLIIRSSSLTNCRSVQGLVAFHASTLAVVADPTEPGRPSYIAAHHRP